jgi:dTDP-4-dehydrorhamnose reductase
MIFCFLKNNSFAKLINIRNMSLKKVLLLGSNGLLGQHLANDLLKESEYELIASSLGENRLSFLAKNNYFSLDITQIYEVEKFIHAHKVDIIINCAAISSVDSCDQNPIQAYMVNSRAVENIARICREQNIYFIQLSTDFVFDGVNPPYMESDLPKPINYYGITKLEAERFFERHNPPGAIIRTILLYGRMESSNRQNILHWIYHSLKRGVEIKVVHDQFRSPTYVNDLSTAILTCIKSNKQGLFHVSGKENMSVYEFAVRVAQFYKLDTLLIKPAKSANIPNALLRPPHTDFILSKAKTELGYNPSLLSNALKNIPFN